MRDQAKVDYQLDILLLTAVLMFACGLGARRNIKALLGTPCVMAKFKALGAPGVPHGDTINDAFSMITATSEVQAVVTNTVDRLIDSKLFNPYRLNLEYLVAIDGSQHLAFQEQHPDHCLTKTKDGVTKHSLQVLEAKVVTSIGLVASLMTEFIENAAPNASKQDCELRGFERLARHLKERFQRLALCLLLDGLYACGTCFAICSANGWHFLATLKDDSLPSVHDEQIALWPMQSAQLSKRTFKTKRGRERVEQEVRWITDIDYTDTENRTHRVCAITCVETVTPLLVRPRRAKKPNPGEEANAPSTTKTYAWVTNYTVTKSNIWALVEAGRKRWKIENEGFNDQKNHGDMRLEHAYSYNQNAIKVFYYTLQLAHLIMQLMRHGGLLVGTTAESVGSMANVAKCMLEAWRNLWRINGLFDPPPRFQIRLKRPDCSS